MTEAVIGGALVAVLEDLVGFVEFLEAVFRLVISRILIRVKLHGELAVGGLQIGVAGAALNAKNLIIVALGHPISPRHNINRRPPSCPSHQYAAVGVSGMGRMEAGRVRSPRAVRELGRQRHFTRNAC